MELFYSSKDQMVYLYFLIVHVRYIYKLKNVSMRWRMHTYVSQLVHVNTLLVKKNIDEILVTFKNHVDLKHMFT